MENYEMTKAYEEMSKALAQLTDEGFENFLKDFEDEYKDFDGEYKELFCKMRGFYKLMTDKSYYEKIQNEVARRSWKEAQAV